MKSDFYTAIAQIAAERGIPKEAVLSSVEHALSARSAPASARPNVLKVTLRRARSFRMGASYG